ncbi:MAG: caspase domain-containing protein, partial [Betaproteobacteria bacterium]
MSKPDRRTKLPILSQAPFFSLVLLASVAHASERNHALLVGIGQYSAASESSPLPGVPKDLETARKMALAMGIPAGRITELRDSQATKANIVSALDQLRRRVAVGEKVFIYFSGHGTSHETRGVCQQGIVPYTEGRHTQLDVLTEAELASYTSKISEKADKAIVMVDACFSGGLVASATRSFGSSTTIRPKFVARGGDQCGVAVNQPLARSFAPAMQRLGVPQQNFVQISAANYNEVSWDNEQLGGLATHSLGECLLGDAKDLNSSGAITLDEVRQCAQEKLDRLMAPHKAA